jgi:hypothetical protein
VCVCVYTIDRVFLVIGRPSVSVSVSVSGSRSVLVSGSVSVSASGSMSVSVFYGFGSLRVCDDERR